MKLKDLRLALSATPKKPDIRYYLNGLSITETHVSGSNGHVLCHINTYDNIIPDDNIIVPVDTIKALLKKLGTKHENKEVGIFLNNGWYELQCMNQVEVFTPIRRKYPEFKELITAVKAAERDKHLTSICLQFDWRCLAVANAALCKYFDNPTPKKLYSVNAYSDWTKKLSGFMMPSDDVIYVIMPWRI